MIKIVVDSTCDLPDETVKKYDIEVLPLRVQLNDRDFEDRVTITVDEVYDAMRKGIYPKTSQPNLMESYELFKGLAQDGSDFIFLSFSSKLSGTYQMIYGIINELQEQYSKINMAVIDTKSGSTATGLMALEAAVLVEKGIEFRDILQIMEELSRCVEHIFTIDDLNWLIKAGRISKAEGMIGSILGIKPILDVENGSMKVIKKVRGRKKALNEVVSIVEERIAKFPNQIIGISHADDMGAAVEIARMLEIKLGTKKVIINKIGSVLGAHIGIGGVGVFFFNTKPEKYLDISFLGRDINEKD